MKNIIYVFLALAIALSACKKEQHKQFSTWYVNGQEFKTNEVHATRGKATHILGTDWTGYQKGFSIQFHSGYFPYNETLLLKCGNVQNPAWCCVTIHLDGTSYEGQEGAVIRGVLQNNKASYILDSTWMYSVLDRSDSILVYGTFNEP